MVNFRTLFALGSALFMAPLYAGAEEPEPTAIIEVGGAAQWGLRDGGSSYGPNLGAETTPVPGILELEADVTPYFSRGQTDWDMDFLFKKPFDLTDTLEFMAGLGPEWDRTVSHGSSTDTIGAEVAGDFMYWPNPDRHFGWYVEPAYSYSFGAGHEQSLSVSVGLLIPVR